MAVVAVANRVANRVASWKRMLAKVKVKECNDPRVQLGLNFKLKMELGVKESDG